MPNGDVTSCGPLAFIRSNFIAGNIKITPLNILWNSSHFQNIRTIQQKDFYRFCSKCKYWINCFGSCRAAAASIGGKILSSYPVCEEYSKHYPEKLDVLQLLQNK